jgi:hypothetical protein
VFRQWVMCRVAKWRRNHHVRSVSGQTNSGVLMDFRAYRCPRRPRSLAPLRVLQGDVLLLHVELKGGDIALPSCEQWGKGVACWDFSSVIGDPSLYLPIAKGPAGSPKWVVQPASWRSSTPRHLYYASSHLHRAGVSESICANLSMTEMFEVLAIYQAWIQHGVRSRPGQG